MWCDVVVVTVLGFRSIGYGLRRGGEQKHGRIGGRQGTYGRREVKVVKRVSESGKQKSIYERERERFKLFL